MNWIDTVLDYLHLALIGTARVRRGNPEAVAVAGALVLAGVAFGFELTHATLGVDDFAHLDFAFRWDEFWIGRGMWGGLLVQYLTPGSWITPFVSLVIGILLQLLAAVLMGWALEVRALAPPQLALLYALFVTFPYFACQMAFSYVQIGYPLASLLMVGGILLALAGDARRTVGAAMAIGFAMFIYQGSLSVLAPLALLAPLAGHGNQMHQLVTRYRRVLVAALAAGALYLAIHRLILAVMGIVPQNPYYSVSLDWRFWERWPLIRGEILFLLLGAGDVIPARAVVIFLLAALVLLVYMLGRQRSAFQRLHKLTQCFVFAAALVTAPFLMLFLHAGELAPRSSVGVAVIWFALFAGMLSASAPGVRRAGMAFLAVIVAFFLFQDNRMFYSQYLVTQADSIMMARIAERIDQLATPRAAAAIDVVVIGQYSHPQYAGMPRFKGEVLGYSQFEWDPGVTRWHMRDLARSIGVDHYAWHDPKDLGGTFGDPALLQGRQPWPHRSSVFAHDGYAVVWLGKRRDERRVTPLRLWYEALKKAGPGG